MTTQLSDRERKIIRYCAALRDVPGDVIPDADWVRLIDALAIAANVSDARRECAYCKDWQHAGAVSGEGHGRGKCKGLSYNRPQRKGMYYLPVQVGRWDDTKTDYGRKQDVQGMSDLFTVGNFCCSYFRPRKGKRR